MASNDVGIRARLDAWRDQGADGVDPVRFGVIDALERRALRYDGPVRDLLQDRLTALMAEYASALAATAQPGGSRAANADSQTQTRPGSAVDVEANARRRFDPGSSPLRSLLDVIGAAPKTTQLPTRAEETGAAFTAALPPLPALAEFQQLWGRIRTDSQLRQSLASVPEGAGPLHSSTLLHRAMTLMRETSPDYLQHFVAYVDALSWMEQLHGADMVETKPKSRSGDGKHAGKTRARKRGGLTPT